MRGAFGFKIVAYNLVLTICTTRQNKTTSIIPEHRLLWEWRLVANLVLRRFSCNLLINVSRSHTNPQHCAQARVMQDNANLEKLETRNSYMIMLL